MWSKPVCMQKASPSLSWGVIWGTTVGLTGLHQQRDGRSWVMRQPAPPRTLSCACCLYVPQLNLCCILNAGLLKSVPRSDLPRGTLTGTYTVV
jgi:hypothetical protein